MCRKGGKTDNGKKRKTKRKVTSDSRKLSKPVEEPSPASKRRDLAQASLIRSAKQSVKRELDHQSAVMTAKVTKDKKDDDEDPGDGAYEDVNVVPAGNEKETQVGLGDSTLNAPAPDLPKEGEGEMGPQAEGEKPIIDAASRDAISLLLKVDPARATFRTAGGVSLHNVTNKGLIRFAFKIKCSNNNEYGISPVYGFIDPMSSCPVKITRLPGIPKVDKMVIQWVQTTPGTTDPKEAFRSASPLTMQSVQVTLEMTDTYRPGIVFAPLSDMKASPIVAAPMVTAPRPVVQQLPPPKPVLPSLAPPKPSVPPLAPPKPSVPPLAPPKPSVPPLAPPKPSVPPPPAAQPFKPPPAVSLPKPAAPYTSQVPRPTPAPVSRPIPAPPLSPSLKPTPITAPLPPVAATRAKPSIDLVPMKPLSPPPKPFTVLPPKPGFGSMATVPPPRSAPPGGMQKAGAMSVYAIERK
ncbi:hypothetical protein Q1695_013618 [Nippostrongylus brasiliensis]|nr:hypothetical protein Q1695_013618 [Nippostrongylus brasiliensis]